MVRELEQEQESYRSRLFHFKGMYENAGRHTKSLSVESAGAFDSDQSSPSSEADLVAMSKSQPGQEGQKIGSLFIPTDKGPRSRFSKDEAGSRSDAKETLISDMEQMKERYAKLLLGEDMSGGGKGVSSALALSNAITNLAELVSMIDN